MKSYKHTVILILLILCLGETLPTLAQTGVSIGIARPGSSQYLLDMNHNFIYEDGDAFIVFSAGAVQKVVVGDWNGDGRTKIGVYSAGYWALDYNGNGVWDGPNGGDRLIGFGGNAGETPVVGDWNGDGRAKVGVYNQGFWRLDYNGNGVFDGGDRSIAWGGNTTAADGAIEQPVIGDWNGDGRTKVGYFYDGRWALDYDGDGAATAADKFYSFANQKASDKAVVGKWVAGQPSRIGVYNGGFWVLDINGDGAYSGPSEFFAYGGHPNEVPVVGDWNGSGSTKIGVYYSGFWTLDYNGNGSSDSQDINTGFGGNAGDVPIVGTWTITPGVGTKIAAPSSLQSNLGNIPIDLYTSNTDVSSAPYPYPKICPAGGSLRSCYQKIFQYLRSQNVTGVRFQFGLCGNPGFYSTALINCGQNWTAVSLSTTWVPNLKAFYLDLYNAGIRNITPTPTHGDYVSASVDPNTTPLTVYRATTPGPGANGNPPMFCGMSPTMTRFNATEPFGRRACHSSSPYFCDSAHGENCNSSCEKDYDLPVDDHLNGWNCSPANPIFVGWNNLNNVIKETIQSAVDTPSAGARGLTVFEVDLENEIDITEYPVEARYILDNTNTDTGNPASFEEISNYMGSSGYDSRRVTYSAYDTRPSVPGYNSAVDFYSGYGRITALSSLFAAIGGGPIGLPADNSVTNGLYSGGLFPEHSPALPHPFTQPDILDVHMYPCVIDTAPGPNNGYCLRGSSTPQTMTEAQLPLSDINDFITAHNQQSSLFMLGEVHSNSDGGYADIPNVQYSSDSSRKGGTCELRASVSPSNGGNAPSLVVAGYNSSTLSGHNSVFRPWINVPQQDGCFVYPVNYQLNIYNSGPYRPSN